ncbi:UPF0149 family protein [Aliikangiella maris]|uniref:UPF0149 family protein n=2 Tax=Aliikangiella maris TaxID=3162458 RepID=A0ABV3MQP1_9GAMM
MSNFNQKEIEICFNHPSIKNAFNGLYECLGLITAVATSPEEIPPAEWMDRIRQDPTLPPEFESKEQIKTFSSNLVGWWNDCLTIFDHGQKITLPDKLALTATSKANKALKEFCRGYLAGNTWLSQVWQKYLPDDDSHASRSLSVLNIILARFIDEKALADNEPILYNQLPDIKECFKSLPTLISAVGMLGKDLSQASDDNLNSDSNLSTTDNAAQIKPTQHLPIKSASRSVGRNSLCPCGSGKKFKKCCLH